MSLRKKVRRQPKHSEGSWAVSYVDMLTLLLCFFIIFYNDSQSKSEESLLQKIALDISGKTSGNGAGEGKNAGGSGTSGIGAAAVDSIGHSGDKTAKVGMGNAAVSSEDLALLALIQAKLQKELPANIKTGERTLEINFEGISFFESGKTKVLPEAEVQIQKVIDLLSKYKDIVRVTVQGHTDPTKTSKKHTFSDNWELSALRATSVLKLFIKNGYSQENLSAEGFADSRANREVASELSKDDLAKLRKITLRIEPVQVKK